MADSIQEGMTWLEVAEKLEGLISRLETEGSRDGWEWGFMQSQSDEAHVADFATTLSKTRDHFKLQGDTEIHGVFVDGTDLKIAVTGNSPSAASRAEYLCAVSPKNITALVAYIREKEGQ